MRLLCIGFVVLAGCASGAESSHPETPRPRPEPRAALVSEAPPAPSATTVTSVEPEPAPPIERPTVVLHIGDSFVQSGLAQGLKVQLEPLRVRYVVNAQHSTNSVDWASRVDGLVASYRPDLVLVTLGGNEIGSRHLAVQARAIERIVRAIGDRPCVWITPPLWREELGLFDTIQTHVAPCRFFETDLVLGRRMPRRSDGIHPTAEGGGMWADSLFAWLMRERVGAPNPWALRDAPDSERTARGQRTALAE